MSDQSLGVLVALVVAFPISYIGARFFQLVVADWVLARWATPTLSAILVVAACVCTVIVIGGLAVMGAWSLVGLP